MNIDWTIAWKMKIDETPSCQTSDYGTHIFRKDCTTCKRGYSFKQYIKNGKTQPGFAA
jgi:hypothetical protein